MGLDRVQALDRDQAISSVRTMEDLVESEVGQRRLLVILLGSFAGERKRLHYAGLDWPLALL